MPNEFSFQTCIVQGEYTGIKAESLEQFIDKINHVPLDSLFFHFTRTIVQRGIEYNNETWNDFSNWAIINNDNELSENLNLVPLESEFNIEEAKEKLVELIKEKSNEGEFHVNTPFYFLRPRIYLMKLKNSLDTKQDLIDALHDIHDHSFYYHFVIYPWLKDYFDSLGSDIFDRVAELTNHNIANRIKHVNPYVQGVEGLRNEIISIIQED